MSRPADWCRRWHLASTTVAFARAMISSRQYSMSVCGIRPTATACTRSIRPAIISPSLSRPKRRPTQPHPQNRCQMIAVIFEVWPRPEHKQRYLDLAAELRPLLETIDGFISIERFESIYEPGKMLSLSFFRDEAAVNAWRNIEEHRRAQIAGRAEIFADYRLRIAGVIRDYTMSDRAEVPADSRRQHGERACATRLRRQSAARCP